MGCGGGGGRLTDPRLQHHGRRRDEDGAQSNHVANPRQGHPAGIACSTNCPPNGLSDSIAPRRSSWSAGHRPASPRNRDFCARLFLASSSGLSLRDAPGNAKKFLDGKVPSEPGTRSKGRGSIEKVWLERHHDLGVHNARRGAVAKHAQGAHLAGTATERVAVMTGTRASVAIPDRCHQMSSDWIASAIFLANIGGTAFPTWWYCSVLGPQNR